MFSIGIMGGVSIELWSLAALLPLWLYNGRRGYSNRAVQYGFYAFYPVHILILSLIALYVYTDKEAAPMAKNKEEKTNVMRTLDQKKIPYTAHSYDPDGPIDGVSVAQILGQPPEQVFKTLVTKAASGAYYVFDIPVAENLDLKKAAKAVGEKSVAMLPQKELLPLTGYVHGGCSPVGMKKQFPTVFHETALLYGTICVSAGKIGHQVECDPNALIALLRAKTADVIV